MRTSANKYTEKIVIEVGLDTTGEVESRLPLELLSLLDAEGLWDGADYDPEIPLTSVSSVIFEAERILTPIQRHFAFLLGWMTTFDAFENTVSPLIDIVFCKLTIVTVVEGTVGICGTASQCPTSDKGFDTITLRISESRPTWEKSFETGSIRSGNLLYASLVTHPCDKQRI